MQTFAERCQAAQESANRIAAPFTPSRAQQEIELMPLVADLLATEYEDAAAYIRATYKHEGLQPLALTMFKTVTL